MVMSIHEVLANMVERAGVKKVYGDPITAGERVAIPEAFVRRHLRSNRKAFTAFRERGTTGNIITSSLTIRCCGAALIVMWIIRACGGAASWRLAWPRYSRADRTTIRTRSIFPCCW